jgi:NAD(P)-dependent dehydrogenase (short-subunit alcohol dehydrogenase family)
LKFIPDPSTIYSNRLLKENAMKPEMQGKVALITGGSSGIGEATAHLFAQHGAKVVIASRNAERGEKVAQAIREVGSEALWVQTDVSQAAEVKALVKQTVQAYGQLDFAFNNGGSGGQGGWTAEMEPVEWDKTIQGFLNSVFYCMKFELIEMLKQGHGAIVNNSSVDGLRAFPWDPAYSAAKHGVLGLTKSAAMQYANQGIRINAICPGWIRTPPTEQVIEQNPGIEQQWLTHQPIGRLGRPEEVAEAVLWLCSEAASLVTGLVMPVDGGYTIV